MYELAVPASVTPPVLSLSPPWEKVVQLFSDPVSPEVVEPYEFVFDSPLLRADPKLAAYARPSFTAGAPLLAVIPGGGGNVFAQALGLPVDTAAAIARIKEAIQADRYRTIGLGLAGDRYFTFSAGLGMDAEVVREVERLRASGQRESPALFIRTIVRQYRSGTDRRTPALILERDGQPSVPDLFMTAITNRSPWTYVHGRALLPVPNPDLNSGLDVFALRKLRATTILSAIGQMMLIRGRSTRGRNVLTVTGLESLTIRSVRPIAFQVDGDYLGEAEAVKFQFVPRALRVVA